MSTEAEIKARRERTIEFEMTYCRHYESGKGAKMTCAAGMDIDNIKKVATGKKQIKWGPCIEGHLLENPLQHCPKWERHTREDGEKRADSAQRSIDIIEKVEPFISEWRKKEPIGKREIVECPACKGRLHLAQSSYNGHVHARCETDACVAFME
jgi:hypothetical protein